MRRRSPTLVLLCCMLVVSSVRAQTPEHIELDVKPKICTLAADDEQCETTVRANWRASRTESLCLVIVGRPEIKRCWEQYSEGNYRVEIAFDQDLVVELRDPQLERVLASTAITIIREALQLRRKRRQPWNLIY